MRKFGEKKRQNFYWRTSKARASCRGWAHFHYTIVNKNTGFGFVATVLLLDIFAVPS